MPPIESLTSVRLKEQWHAIYPSAERTLCLEQADTTAVGRRYPPTCSICIALAKDLDAIDGAIPSHWRTMVTTAQGELRR